MTEKGQWIYRLLDLSLGSQWVVETGVPRFGRRGVKNRAVSEDAIIGRLLTGLLWGCFCLGGRPKQLISGTESSEGEVETVCIGMGISPGPLVPLSPFSSSPWVDGLDLHGVNQHGHLVLPA